MKKIPLLSLIAATVLFTACGEETKKTETNTTTSVTQRLKESATHAMDVAKVAAKEAVEVAKVEAKKVADAVSEKATEATEAIKETTADTVDAAKEVATEATVAVEAEVASNAIGEEAYAKCKGCHGADGKTKALGKSAAVAGQPAADLETALAGYKAGTRDVSGMGMLMKGQVSSMSDEEIKAVAAYMSNM